MRYWSVRRARRWPPCGGSSSTPRCLEYGRLLAHQSLDCPGSPATARRLSGALGHPAGRTGGCSTRHLRQPRRLAGRQTQGHAPSRRRRLALRSCREYQTQTPLQKWLVLPGLHRRGWDDSGDLRPAAQGFAPQTTVDIRNEIAVRDMALECHAARNESHFTCPQSWLARDPDMVGASLGLSRWLLRAVRRADFDIPPP